MSQPSGTLAGKMLWLVPRYVEVPGTLMRLGSVLTDPENLESSLNLHSIPPIPADSQRDASLAVKRHVEVELSKSNSLLVKAAPNIPAFASVGAEISGGWNRDASTTVQALNVRATVFIPTKAYMNAVLGNPNVIEYARRGLFSKPLYIIVGTATASKLSIQESQSRDRRAGALASFAPAGTGGIAV